MKEVDNKLDVFYQILNRRRDVRTQFTGEEIPENKLLRILNAAHSATSVGLSQPWDFILVKDIKTREEFKNHVLTERKIFLESLPESKAKLFENIKVEGIMESSMAIVATYDSSRGAPHVLGRHSIDEAGLYSVCLAIENLWLAATYENLGIGWVSFYREEYLKELLGIPNDIRPIAWLCVGPVTHFESIPDLERLKWRTRAPLDNVIHFESW